MAERVRDMPPSREPEILSLPAGCVLAGFISLGLLGTVGEAGLLHFRGAFQNPFMVLPVTLPPIAAGLWGEAALQPAPGAACRQNFSSPSVCCTM
jgi:hypothetical protein